MTFYVTEVCPSCGNLRSVCSDEDLSDQWFPQRSVCYATAAKEAAWRAVRAKHKESDRDASGPHILDGWGIWASQFDLTPADDFEGALRVLGAPVAGGEPDDQQQYADDSEHDAGLSDVFSSESGEERGD